MAIRCRGWRHRAGRAYSGFRSEAAGCRQGGSGAKRRAVVGGRADERRGVARGDWGKRNAIRGLVGKDEREVERDGRGRGMGWLADEGGKERGVDIVDVRSFV